MNLFETITRRLTTVLLALGSAAGASGVALVPPMHAQTTAGGAAGATATTAPAAHYVPHRVFDSHHKRWVDFETLVERANASDVVFVGEQHNDTPGHGMEFALLEGIARRRAKGGGPVVLSLEMFERDTQDQLDAYLAGARDEATFLAASRPWPNYDADYRPLVELARTLKWPVIAANVPRPLAAVVSHGGLKALDTLNTSVRSTQVASELSCPEDRYFKLFAEVMSQGHGGPAPATPVSPDSARAAAAAADAMTRRFYEAQCVKDETMGESVARALAAARTRSAGALVVHVNGAFHTDYALGTAERTLRRVKGARALVVSIVPVADLDHVDAKALRKRADYLVFTLAGPES